MKTLAGLLFVLVGITGIVLSGLGAISFSRTADWLERNVPQKLDELEHTLVALSQQLEAMRTTLDGIDARLDTMHPALNDLAQSGDDRPIPDALRQSLDRTVITPLRNMEELILSTQNTMRSLSSALLVLDSVPVFSLTNARRQTDGERPLRSVSASLEDTAELLHQVLEAMASLDPAQKLSTQQLSQPLRVLTTARSRLDGIRVQTRHVAWKLESAQASVTMVRQRADEWMVYGNTACVLVSICFGFTQLSLLMQGIRMAVPGKAASRIQ